MLLTTNEQHEYYIIINWVFEVGTRNRLYKLLFELHVDLFAKLCSTSYTVGIHTYTCLMCYLFRHFTSLHI